MYQQSHKYRLLKLLDLLYESAIDSNIVGNLATGLSEYFSIDSATLQIRDNRNGTVKLISCTDNFSEKSIKDYEAHYFSQDLWVDAVVRNPSEIAGASHLHISNADMKSNEWGVDYCRQVGDVFYAVGAKTILNPYGDFASIGIHKKYNQGIFNPEDVQRFQLILPHIQRALQLQYYLQQVSDLQISFENIISKLGIGALIVDEKSRILLANAAAEIWLGDGGLLNIKNGCLCLWNSTQTNNLTRKISDTASNSLGRYNVDNGGWFEIRRPGAMPLKLLLAPLPKSCVFNSPSVIIFLHTERQQDPFLIRKLQQIYGLTPTEADLAASLMHGGTIDKFSNFRKISANTTKNHLSRTLSKMGINSQANLIRELLLNPLLR